jgi:hypothetical protein
LSRPRPRRALRPSATVRVARVAVPLALVGLGTSGVVAFALPGSDAQTAVPAASTTAAPVTEAVEREAPVSRDVFRPPSPSPTATSEPEAKKKSAPKAEKKEKPKPKPPSADDLAADPEVSGTRYATDDLNIRTDPSRSSDVVTVVRPGTKLSVTSVDRSGFRLVVYKGKGRWVTAAYLSSKKPSPAKLAQASGGITRAACGKSPGIDSGLTPDAVLVHRAVCANFPQVTSFGGRRGGGGDFHATGQAVDCMISDSTAGWALARWVRSHARELGVSEVIYAQKIWTVQRSGEGWRSMSDRGSATANHYDHVHVSVYGNRAA